MELLKERSALVTHKTNSGGAEEVPVSSLAVEGASRGNQKGQWEPQVHWSSWRAGSSEGFCWDLLPWGWFCWFYRACFATSVPFPGMEGRGHWGGWWPLRHPSLFNSFLDSAPWRNGHGDVQKEEAVAKPSDSACPSCPFPCLPSSREGFPSLLSSGSLWSITSPWAIFPAPIFPCIFVCPNFDYFASVYYLLLFRLLSVIS